MATPSINANPTPEHIFNTLNAYQQSLALRSGIELDIFSAIADGAKETALLARKTGASERGIRTLCDYLTVLGFLTKKSGKYGLAQDSTLFLDRKSPAYMGAIAGFLVKR